MYIVGALHLERFNNDFENKEFFNIQLINTVYEDMNTNRYLLAGLKKSEIMGLCSPGSTNTLKKRLHFKYHFPIQYYPEPCDLP